MVRQHGPQRQAQAGQVVRRRPHITGKREQRPTGRGPTPLVVPAVAEQAARPLLGIEPVTCRRIDGIALGGTGGPTHEDVTDWDDRAALKALAGNAEHVASVRQLFLSELPTTRSACLAAFDRGDSATLRAQLHRLQASCGFTGAAALAAIASRWHAAPADPDLREAFATACARLLTAAS